MCAGLDKGNVYVCVRVHVRVLCFVMEQVSLKYILFFREMYVPHNDLLGGGKKLNKLAHSGPAHVFKGLYIMGFH